MSKLIVRNSTPSSITVSGYNVYSVDSSITEIVEVIDSLENKYKSLKCSVSGTAYYYVIDGIHNSWTDDLSSIGYSEVQPAPVLPTVSSVTIYTDNTDHYFQIGVTNQTTQVDSQYTYNLYTDSGCTTTFIYDLQSLYLVGYMNSGIWTMSAVQSVSDMPSSTTGDISSSVSGKILQSNGKLWLVSNYNGTLHDGGYQWSYILKICSSNQATVVPVYDSSNVAYNAFQFTDSGTDYYYVLDGTQVDWTDDLSSIGYSLTPVYNAYTKADQTTGDINNIPMFIYDASGNKIPVDKTKKYTITQYKVSSSGNWITNTTAFIADASQEYLQVYTSGSTYSTYCFEYTVEENVDGYATYDMFTNQTNSRTDPQDIHYSGIVLYYNGTRVQYDPGYVMTNRAYSYNFSSHQVYKVSNMTKWSLQVGYPDYAYMQLYSNDSSAVYASDIIVEKRQASCAYFSPNKSDVSVAYHVNTLIYDENGNTIPYDTTKTYIHSAEKTYDNKWSKLSLSLVNMDGYLGYYCNNTGNGYVSLFYVVV